MNVFCLFFLSDFFFFERILSFLFFRLSQGPELPSCLEGTEESLLPTPLFPEAQGGGGPCSAAPRPDSASSLCVRAPLSGDANEMEEVGNITWR